MIKLYFRQAIHSLCENKLISIISISGIAFAIAVMLVVVLMVQIDMVGFAPESNRGRTLHVLGTTVKYVDGAKTNNGSMSKEVADVCFYSLQTPEQVTAYTSVMMPVMVSLPHKRLYKEYTPRYADANYWKVFDYQFLEGKPFSYEDFQSGAHTVVISEKVAANLFGKASAVGKKIMIDFMEFTVCGVVRNVPLRGMTSFFELCMPYTSNEYLLKPSNQFENMAGRFMVSILAHSKTDFDAIKSEVDTQVKKLNSEKKQCQLNFPSGLLSQSDIAMGAGFKKADWKTFFISSGLIMFLLLLVPALNLIGVIQSAMQKRKEEIGLRKAFGATNKDLIFQLLVENMVQTSIGGVIGIALSIVLLYWGKSFLLIGAVTLTADMLFKPWLFLSAIVLTFLLNVLSAGIPAWITMRQPITEAINGTEN